MPTLSQHACFSCRKVFKKPHEYSLTPTVRRCPQCGGGMIAMGYKFRAPVSADVREWSRIETALREGRDYGISAVRHEKPRPKAPRRFPGASGVSGRAKPKRGA